MKIHLLFASSVLLLLATGCSSSNSTDNSDNNPQLDPQLDPPALTTISSRFDTDDEEWLISGDAQGTGITPTYVIELADASAHIAAEDNVSGGIWYFSAPEKFLGNLNEYYAGTFVFELKTSSTVNSFVERDVILKSGDTEINFQLPRLPEAEFTTFSVNLTEAGWVDSSGEPVDVNSFTSVLTNVDGLFIRGEYNSGADTGGLDNVVLSMEK